MSKKLLMNNYSENGFEWDYEKKSDVPISLKKLCSEYVNNTNIILNTFSYNQMVEVDISEVKYGNNNPQIMLLCDNNSGGKAYWDYDGNLRLTNDSDFALKLNCPAKLRVKLKDNIVSLYINEVLQAYGSISYNNMHLTFTGVQLGAMDIIATGFRYKNFE